MKIEISESDDGERLKIVFDGTFVVEIPFHDASPFGQKLADRARFRYSMGDEDPHRTETTKIESSASGNIIFAASEDEVSYLREAGGS